MLSFLGAKFSLRLILGNTKMNDRDTLTVTSRERLRQEIAQQTELYLRAGGRIEHLHTAHTAARPVGSVWWDARGSSGSLLQA
jgi:hypothetical protein